MGWGVSATCVEKLRSALSANHGATAGKTFFFFSREASCQYTRPSKIHKEGMPYRSLSSVSWVKAETLQEHLKPSDLKSLCPCFTCLPFSAHN